MLRGGSQTSTQRVLDKSKGRFTKHVCKACPALAMSFQLQQKQVAGCVTRFVKQL